MFGEENFEGLPAKIKSVHGKSVISGLKPYFRFKKQDKNFQLIDKANNHFYSLLLRKIMHKVTGKHIAIFFNNFLHIPPSQVFVLSIWQFRKCGTDLDSDVGAHLGGYRRKFETRVNIHVQICRS